MTSPRFNAQRRAALEEMQTFDRLSPRLREAIKNSARSVKAKTVWDALLRGVSEEKLIETIKGAKNADGRTNS